MNRRTLLSLLAVATLTACLEAKEVTQDTPKAQLGDFAFGHNVVVTTDVKKSVLSRKEDPEVIGASLKAALDERLRRYDGDKLYHLGIKVEAYALAPPGIPVLFKPKSALILTVTAWDDAAGEKLNEEARLFTILEGTSAKTFIGSGLTRKKDEQLEVLSRNAARRIERWLEENGEWFGAENIDVEISQDEDNAAAIELLTPTPEQQQAAIAAQESANSN